MKKFISSLLVFVLMFGVTVFPASIEAFAAKSIEDYNDEYDELEKQLKQKEAYIKNAEADIKDKEAYVEVLNEQINTVQGQIDVLDERIAVLDSEIAILDVSINELAAEIAVHDSKITALEKDITETNLEVEETFEQLKARVRASYISGAYSILEILLTSEDISAFLIRTEYLKRSAENDNMLIVSLDKQITKLQSLEKEVEIQRKEVADKKSVYDAEKSEIVSNQNDIQSSANILERKKQDIAAKKIKAASIIDQLDRNSQAYKEQILQIENDMKDISDKIEELLKNPSNSSSGKPAVTEGNWIKPLTATSIWISSDYGYRTHPITGERESFHTGIDITGNGIHGKPIVAAKSGVVVGTNSDSWGGGYGNYLLIDHGNGEASLYAHCDSRVAKLGQTVRQGELIAYVGTTGRSNGSHLHFEIRINGSTVNPLNYISI